MLSLDVAPQQQILEIISTTPENGSETDSSKNGKKSSYENLKNKVSSLNRLKKKNFFSCPNTYNSADWTFLHDFQQGKKVIL